jgi:hypothetical protein
MRRIWENGKIERERERERDSYVHQSARNKCLQVNRMKKSRLSQFELCEDRVLMCPAVYAREMKLHSHLPDLPGASAPAASALRSILSHVKVRSQIQSFNEDGIRTT